MQTTVNFVCVGNQLLPSSSEGQMALRFHLFRVPKRVWTGPLGGEVDELTKNWNFVRTELISHRPHCSLLSLLHASEAFIGRSLKTRPRKSRLGLILFSREVQVLIPAQWNYIRSVPLFRKEDNQNKEGIISASGLTLAVRAAFLLIFLKYSTGSNKLHSGRTSDKPYQSFSLR